MIWGLHERTLTRAGDRPRAYWDLVSPAVSCNSSLTCHGGQGSRRLSFFWKGCPSPEIHIEL